MMRAILLISAGVLLSSGCHRAALTLTTGASCSAEQARAVAYRAFTRQKQPNQLVVTSSETDSTYVFEFDLADRYTKGIEGGGGQVVISKSGCRITRLRRYQ